MGSRDSDGEWIIDDNTETESLHSYWSSSSETPAGTGVWIMWCSNFWVENEVTLTCLAMCDDTCSTSTDGICDDGGPESVDSTCEYGTHCADCGNRGGNGQVAGECVEETDRNGRHCGQFVAAGYQCALLVYMYGMDCHCTC